MKKIIKNTISIVAIVAVLAVSFCVAVSTPAYAASKPSLSRSSITISAGKTIKLTVKNPGKKVKWKSSDKSIAYVKSAKGKYGQKAVIKAKKAGSCTITARIGKKKLTCRITVKKSLKLSKSTRDLTSTVKTGKVDRLEADSRFKNAAADFSFDLLRKTVEMDSAKGKSVNTLISPDSMLSALVMTENGAKGQTLREMHNALSGGIKVSDYNKYLSGLNHRLTSLKTVKYNVANSIWTREGGAKIKKDFLKKNKTYHDAQVFRAPFNDTTVSDMNKWVSANTNGMIKRIINSLTPDVQVVLINAIAFEGSWQEKFSKPTPDKFTPADGNAKDVPTLHQRDSMEYIAVNGGKGFVKRYNGGQIAFVGLLPPEGSSVDDYLEGLSGKSFISAWKARKSKYLDVSVPEFKYDYDASMVAPLMSMGMQKAFSMNADFSGMVVPSPAVPGVHIDDVIHKTHIELDMNGTKAAAATAVVMKANSIIHEDEFTEVHLDRPFVYALVDTKTGIPLFVGILRDVK